MSGIRLMLAAAVALLLGLVVAWEATRPAPSLVASAPAAAPTAEAAPYAAPDPAQQQQWVTTILARPLFSPSRRPQRAATPAQTAAAAPKLPRVAGTMVIGNDRRVIFAATGTARPLVVGEGGEVNGFRVQSIEPGRVTVVGPAGTQVLRASFDPNPAAPAAAAPTPSFVPGTIPGLPTLLPGGQPGAPPVSPITGLPPLPGLPFPPGAR